MLEAREIYPGSIWRCVHTRRLAVVDRVVNESVRYVAFERTMFKDIWAFQARYEPVDTANIGDDDEFVPAPV